jgi:hypothetical protein
MAEAVPGSVPGSDSLPVWAVFDREQALVSAVVDVRGRGLDIVDIYSPYAVHGLEHAAGFRRSRMHFVAFVFGSLGVLCALALQYWTTAISWPINVGNKPWNSWPAFIPVTFEMTVLFAGVGSVLVFLALSRLWPGRKAKLPFVGLTDDRFALGVMPGADAPQAQELEQLLRDHGAIATVIGTPPRPEETP